MRISLAALVSISLAVAIRSAARGDDPRPGPLGHSLHGEAFDDGPRQAAVILPGMGEVRFPVTTSSPEAQKFFTQGVAQLHTFYYFEAERSFRQAALLDPECAMAYWGMAMANANNGQRAQGFLKRAQDRRGAISDREKQYLDTLGALYREGAKDSERREGYLHGLEAIVLDHPDDLEARAFLAWAIVGGGVGGGTSRVAVNSLIESVIEKNPLHPGAHHYRIHLWDGNDPQRALESALSYARAAPGIAHAWHMPGHIFNGLSRWREASYQQEASARVDHAHMLERAIMPFDIHNYAHNEHYLIANLNHVGRPADAIDFARNLIESPRDPQKNNKDGGAQRLGRSSLLRVYVRYQRWKELLEDPHLDWSDVPVEQAWNHYGRGLAHLGLGDPAKARAEGDELDRIAAQSAKTPGYDADLIETARSELRGKLLLADGKLLEAFELLEKGTKLMTEKFKGDLSGYPRPFHEILGEAHLQASDWGLAEACFLASLEDRKETLASLAGLTEACVRGGKEKEAAHAYGRYLKARADAEPGLVFEKRLEPFAPRLAELWREEEGKGKAASAAASAGAAAVSGAATTPGAIPAQGAGDLAASGDLKKSTAEDRSPHRDLASLGPKLWTPSPAPDLAAEDPEGKKLKLSELKGQNVILIFYLGADCPHCMEALTLAGKEKASFDAIGTRILAVSADPPAKNRELLAGPKKDSLPFTLLSDPAGAAAKAFGAHDDFENLPLHGVFLIDREGKIRWSRISAEPFRDFPFLRGEAERVDRILAAGKKAHEI